MKQVALLIIDMQKDFVGENAVLKVAGADAVIKPLQQVLAVFRSHNLPIFHILRIHRIDGSDVEWFRKDIFKKTPFAVEGTKGAGVVDELNPVTGEYIIPKIRMSAFIETGLEFMLRTLGIETLVIGGIQTPNCIRTTVFDAMAYGYRTCLIHDATGAQNQEIHEANVLDMKNIGVDIIHSGEMESWLT